MNDTFETSMDPALKRLLAWPSAQVRFDLDTRCNLKCDFCSTGHSGNVGRRATSLEKLEEILPALGREAWSVYLSCGGEPLMHPRFPEVMALVRKHLRGCDVQMVTNATLLDETKARALLEGGLSRVTFSIDSVQAQRYESIRVNARWETTKRNIDRFLELRGTRAWPKVMVNMVLIEENQDEIEAIGQFCAERGIDAFRVQHLQGFADVPTHHKPVPDSPELRARLIRLQRKLLLQGVLFDHPTAPRWEKALSLLLSLRLYRDPVGFLKYLVGGALGSFFSPCRFVGWEGAAWDGVVHSCTEEADRPWQPASETLLAFLRGSRARQQRGGFEACKTCRFHRQNRKRQD